MSEENTPQTPSESPLFQGVLGAGCARPGKANLRLIRRAINGDWDLPADKRRTLIDHLMGVIRHEPKHRRNVMAAVRCLLAADVADLRQELALAGLPLGPLLMLPRIAPPRVRTPHGNRQIFGIHGEGASRPSAES
jgi:hypothetical protein